jgi:hypothetical protein
MISFIIVRAVEIAAALAVFLGLLAFGCGKLLRLWAAEPVGIGVPLIGALIVYFTPQMADMFAALGSTSWWHQAQLGLGVLVLGLQSWFWQRAALNARGGYRDAHAPPNLPWQDLYAPRLVLVPVGLIACYPIYLTAMNDTSGASIPWFGVILSVVVCVVLGLLAWTRRQLMLKKKGTPPVAHPSMPKYRVCRLFVAAPGGPWTATAALVIALVTVWALDSWSDINSTLHTPTVAFIALGCLVAANTVTLALLRDGSEAFVRGVRWLVRWTDCPAALLGDIIGFGLFVSLLLIGGSISEKLGFYDVPSVAWEAPASESPRRTIVQAVADFRKCHGDPDQGAQQGNRLAIIVALQGGASRSAAWSLSVMRMLDERTAGEFSRNLFAISSISGGSLAAVTYSLLRADTADMWNSGSAANGMVALARGDLLVSSSVRIFGTDAYIGFPLRGRSLTHAFEQLWQDKQGFNIDLKKAGLVVSQRARACAPHLLLNGTDVESGGRLITSTIKFEGEAGKAPFSEAIDVLFRMKGDISPANAVMNSARFPVISPPGRLVLQYGDKQVPRKVVDGGVFEGYGLQTAWELAQAMTAVDKKITPVIVIISNDTELASDAVPLGSCRSAANAAAIDQITEAFETNGKHRVSGQEDGTAEILTSPAGFLHSRASHALSEIAWVNRMNCTDGDHPASFQFNLAKPDAEKKQAAPMNWVLSPFACSYMLGEGLLPNSLEADRLADILAGQSARTVQRAKPILSEQAEKLAKRCLAD